MIGSDCERQGLICIRSHSWQLRAELKITPWGGPICRQSSATGLGRDTDLGNDTKTFLPHWRFPRAQWDNQDCGCLGRLLWLGSRDPVWRGEQCGISSSTTWLYMQHRGLRPTADISIIHVFQLIFEIACSSYVPQIHQMKSFISWVRL